MNAEQMYWVIFLLNAWSLVKQVSKGIQPVSVIPYITPLLWVVLTLVGALALHTQMVGLLIIPTLIDLFSRAGEEVGVKDRHQKVIGWEVSFGNKYFIKDRPYDRRFGFMARVFGLTNFYNGLAVAKLEEGKDDISIRLKVCYRGQFGSEPYRFREACGEITASLKQALKEWLRLPMSRLNNDSLDNMIGATIRNSNWLGVRIVVEKLDLARFENAIGSELTRYNAEAKIA